MDRHNDHSPDQAATAAHASAAHDGVRRFQSVEELLGDPSVEEARIYENGKPPIAGDGSAVDRRDFMKLLGVTFAAASASAACGRLPVTTALPYVHKPEELTLGKANWYATTCRGCAASCGVLVKSRDGRPIKVEGNDLHPVSKGGVCAIGQGTVIDLYDGDRVRQPVIEGKPASWKDFDAKTSAALAGYAANGKALALVTPTITGPAVGDIVRRFLAKFPGARHVRYDGPFGAGAIAEAHGLTHAKTAVPMYRFDAASLVLSFGADYLGTWVAPVPFAKAVYGKGTAVGRKVGGDKKAMSKLIQVETRLSLTGSNADERVQILPSQQRGVVLALAKKLVQGAQVPDAALAPELAKVVDQWAEALTAAKGKALVVADSSDVAVQAAVNAINEAVGAYGTTIDLDTTLHAYQGAAKAEAELVDALGKGEVTGVILWGVNPVYDSKLAAKWADGLKKASFSVLLGTRNDETAAVVKHVGAAHHGLESWADHEPVSGVVAVQQPLVNALFDTRQAEDQLLAWAGEQGADGKPLTAWAALVQYWQAAVWPRAIDPVDFQSFWDKTVGDGFTPVKPIGQPIVPAVLPPPPAVPTAPSAAVAAPTAATGTAAGMGSAAAPAGATPTVAPGPAEPAAPQPPQAAVAAPEAASPAALPEGASAVALAAPATAVGLPAAATGTTMPVIALPPVVPGKYDIAGVNKALQAPAPTVAQAGKFEVVLYPKVGIGSGAHSNNPMLQELPDPISKATWGNYAAIAPKTAKELGNLLSSDVVTVSSGAVNVKLPVVLSPGLHPGAVALPVGYGRVAGMGRIVAGLGQNVYPFAALADVAKADIKPTGEKDEVAFAQTHHSYEHRDMVKETSLDAWQKEPKAGNAPIEEMLRDKKSSDPHFTRSLWDRHLYTGYKWGMAIDLNSCTGCGACVIACNIENNIPVVGKKEVLTRREMHWMRIDRYYSEKKTYKAGDYDWEATKDDLLDLADNPEVVHMPMLCQQCDNAPCETVCPVLATIHTSEGLNAQAYNRCIGTRYCANNCPYKVRRFNWFNYPTREMEDKFDVDLVALALNPDIVKRSRGVMEKCSFCVQRIQEAKSDALRPRADGTVPEPTNLDEVKKAEAEGKKLQPKYVVDGSVKPACAQSCPSEAIVFGDMNDTQSEVRKAYNDPRNYSALVEIGTQPAVTYMTKVRNAKRA